MKCKQFFKNVRVRKSAWPSVPILALIVAGSVLFQSTPLNGQTVQETPPCTVATLNGSYGVFSHGFNTNDPEVFFPTAGIGRFTYDGTGNFTASIFRHDPSGAFTIATRGTYTVQPNCTAVTTFENGIRVRLVIVHGGDEYFAATTAPGAISTGIGKRQ